MNSNKMKAVVCTKYGPPEVLKIKEVAKPEAHRYVGKGHKKGGVAITVCHNNK